MSYILPMTNHKGISTVTRDAYLTARIPVPLKKQLERRAAKEQRSVSSLVRLALAQFLRQTAA